MGEEKKTVWQRLLEVKNTLREAAGLLAYIRPYRGLFFSALICMCLSSVMGLALPFLAGSFLDVAAPRADLAEKASQWFDSINEIVVIFIITLAAQAILVFYHGVAFARVGQSVVADLRRHTYEIMIRLPMAFFGNRRVGELTSRLSSDLSSVENAFINTIPQFFRQSITLVGGIVLIFFTSVKLTLLMLSVLPALILVAIIFGRKIHRLSKQAQDRLAESNTIVNETLQGIFNVKAFANEPFESGRYRDSLQKFLQVVFRVAIFQSGFVAFIIFALFGAMVVVLWYGAKLVQADTITVGQLTQFILYTMYVGGAMGHFADLYGQLNRTLGATERVRELLKEKPEVQETTEKSIPRLKGDVVFEEVHFRYPNRTEAAVLKGISFRVPSGRRLALVGPSGAGKSTIISLLLRFYQADSGRILVDGQEAREYPLTQFRNQLAVVPQEVLLFGGTIAENIAYGKPGATQAELEEAARKANAHDFIAKLPQGYQTLVGERGTQLSGGQRQRVAIARAILKDPAILILDEATSSLDSESESLVHEALEELMQHRTTLIIAHRLSTVRSADQIVVIKDGQVLEQGSHEELQNLENGFYRRLTTIAELGVSPN